MSGLNKNRLRNKTISFRVSQEEKRQLEARIKICGIPKGEYFIKSLLHNQVLITAGKFQSDRLSLEFRRLSDRLESIDCTNEQAIAVLEDCKALLSELKDVMSKNVCTEK